MERFRDRVDPDRFRKRQGQKNESRKRERKPASQPVRLHVCFLYSRQIDVPSVQGFLDGDMSHRSARQFVMLKLS